MAVSVMCFWIKRNGCFFQVPLFHHSCRMTSCWQIQVFLRFPGWSDPSLSSAAARACAWPPWPGCQQGVRCWVQRTRWTLLLPACEPLSKLQNTWVWTEKVQNTFPSQKSLARRGKKKYLVPLHRYLEFMKSEDFAHSTFNWKLKHKTPKAHRERDQDPAARGRCAPAIACETPLFCGPLTAHGSVFCDSDSLTTPHQLSDCSTVNARFQWAGLCD